MLRNTVVVVLLGCVRLTLVVDECCNGAGLCVHVRQRTLAPHARLRICVYFFLCLATCFISGFEKMVDRYLIIAWVLACFACTFSWSL